MSEPTAAGASDLKTYDVPDPVKPAGWKLRCILAGLVALGLALGLLRAVRLPHLMWVAEHHDAGYRYGDELGYLNQAVCWDLEARYDAETLRPYVLKIEDPKTRGRFHKVLAGSGDPAQLEAMLAYLRSLGSTTYGVPEIIESMFTLDKVQAPARLVAAYGEAKDDGYASMLAKIIADKIPPADLASHVVKVADPVRRGRFHAALATTKDAAQLDAVMAYARTVLPTDPGSSRPEEWEPLVASLGAFGPVATPRLEAVLEQTESRSLVSLAAEALRTSDLGFLVKRARTLLDEYDANVPQLARYAHIMSELESGGDVPEGVTQEEIATAREELQKATAKAFMIFEMLRAMEPVHGDQAVDFCIVRGLSTFDREIAEWSAMRIKERFTPEKLVDTLFSYIAQKNEFSLAEVGVYEGLLKELGAPGAARVAWNLDRLVREAQGDPEEVFWLYKKMGFTLLGELGGPDSIPVLQKYAADPGSYVLTSTRTDGSGRRTRTQEEKKFADEVRAAIQAIETRGGE